MFEILVVCTPEMLNKFFHSFIIGMLQSRPAELHHFGNRPEDVR